MSIFTNRTFRAGLLFAVIPFFAFALHIFTLGEPPESLAALVYLPFWLTVLGQMGSSSGNSSIVFVGIALTAGIWFLIGLGASALAGRSSPSRYKLALTILFLATVLVTVVLPWIFAVQHDRRFYGIGQTLESCQNAGNEKDMCISFVVIRMINNKDPAVTPEFCNSTPNNDGDMRYCWTYIALTMNISADVCETATLDSARNECLSTLAEKLMDETICTHMKGESGGTAEECVHSVQSLRSYRASSEAAMHSGKAL